jgi:hypothetical protein
MVALCKSLQVTSLSQFVKHVEKLKREAEAGGNPAEFLFRGQPCDKPLIPKLGRIHLKGDLINVEKRMIDQFKRTSHPLTEFQLSNDWDVLALAQHHGLSTRLLDWTQSAFAALWFAVRTPPETSTKPTEVGVVWIFAPTDTDYRRDTDTTSPFDNKATKIFRPKVITRRISALAAVFTAHRIVDGKKFVPLEENRLYEGLLMKLNAHPGSFPSLRRDLDMFGVNYASLFPDLDGLTRYLEWQFSFYSDERRKR